MNNGEIDGYHYAVIEQTGLIVVRFPDGMMRMLPASEDPDRAVRSFIERIHAHRDHHQSLKVIVSQAKVAKAVGKPGKYRWAIL